MERFHFSDIQVGEYALTRWGTGQIKNLWCDCNGWYIDIYPCGSKETGRFSVPLDYVLCLSPKEEFLELYHCPAIEHINVN